MTVDEMINFDISNVVTQIAKEADLRIVNGVYAISQEYELEFNKEEIKKLLLMFKPMQKELATYKKALEMACDEIMWRECRNAYNHTNNYCKANCETYEACAKNIEWEDYFLNKAKED